MRKEKTSYQERRDGLYLYFRKKIWFHRFDQNSNKNIVRISTLKVFIASLGVPLGFLINDYGKV